MSITIDVVWLPWLWTALCVALLARSASRSGDYDFSVVFTVPAAVAGIAIGWAVYFGVTP
jgi:hypothetical protein